MSTGIFMTINVGFPDSPSCSYWIKSLVTLRLDFIVGCDTTNNETKVLKPTRAILHDAQISYMTASQ